MRMTHFTQFPGDNYESNTSKYLVMVQVIHDSWGPSLVETTVRRRRVQCNGAACSVYLSALLSSPLRQRRTSRQPLHSAWNKEMRGGDCNTRLTSRRCCNE